MILVCGAGSWGTALAICLAKKNSSNVVYLWGRNAEFLEQVNKKRENHQYLPGIVLPKNISIVTDFSKVIATCRYIIMAIPSSGLEQQLVNIQPHLQDFHGFVLANKGLDKKHGFAHDCIVNICGPKYPIAILSGPSFALEVAQGLPTSVVLASTNLDFATQVQSLFSQPEFQVQLSDDIIGVALGGVYKNIIAAITGISDGLGYGSNTRATLITKGLSEISLLAKHMHAKSETMLNPAVLGDLILTCTDNQSRNRRFGLALAENQQAHEAASKVGQYVEANLTIEWLYKKTGIYNIKLPMVEALWEIIVNNKNIEQVIDNILLM